MNLLVGAYFFLNAQNQQHFMRRRVSYILKLIFYFQVVVDMSAVFFTLRLCPLIALLTASDLIVSLAKIFN